MPRSAGAWYGLAVRAHLAFICVALVLFPATAHATGIQKTFNAPGISFGGEQTIFHGLAFAADGTLWTSVGARATLYHHTTDGAILGSFTARETAAGGGRPSHGIAVDPANGHIYAMLGGQHSVYRITEYTADGEPLRQLDGGQFPGDFNEGVAVAVDPVTKQVYATGAGGGGKIVRFAADGTVIRAVSTGGGPGDIEVDPVTGDVLVAFGTAGFVRRYDRNLDNARVVATGGAPIGLSLAPDGTLWVSHYAGQVERRAPDGTILSSTTIPAGAVFDVEADGAGGAWVSAGNGYVNYYVATDPPVASFTSNPGGSVPTGTRVEFTSTATDADGTIATRQWDLDGDGVYNDATGSTAARTFATAGTYVVRHRVVDNDGASGARSLSIVVSAQAPTADFTISLAGANATFTSISSDPDGTIVSTRGTSTTTGRSPTRPASPPRAPSPRGRITCTCA